jgi:hypothetical protein
MGKPFPRISKNKDMTLQEEAEKYIKSEQIKSEYYKIYSNEGFIAGANSKYVQAEKLKFAIEQLEEIRDKMTLFEIENMDNTLDNLHYKIQELKQQLKELEG